MCGNSHRTFPTYRTMNTFVIAIAVLLAAVQLAAAHPAADSSIDQPQPFFDRHRECAVEVVDAIRTEALELVMGVKIELEDLRLTFLKCVAKKPGEQEICLEQFARTALEAAYRLYDQVAAGQDVILRFALDRLDDYYNCRTATIVPFATGNNLIFCSIVSYIVGANGLIIDDGILIRLW